ncbi:DUF1648 domain-containing protein [Streptomyces sp. ITFR-6]|uniref:DUF1648 domain-containing protein n=1 Tax=Streptomyces sp. ITFR-6 TaxID=3075197 RepID=UPI0028899188|nr:DUF1648 domain-containing protein [Streptomyces sp. ITFR-6]WNI29332.1 DUF1648 domain-containing protein [Streptomyces sp. ITFR-6]
MNRRNVGRVVLAALPFVLALAADLILFATWRDRLPAHIASHFVGNGRVDDHASRGSYIAIVIVLFAGIGALWVLMAVAGKFTGRSYGRVVASGYAVAGGLGYLMAAALSVNVDADQDAQGRAQDVSFPMWHMAVGVGVAALAFGLGLLLAALLPREDTPAGRRPVAGRDRIDLADGEIAGWARNAGAWWLPLVPLVVLGGGFVLLFAADWIAAIPAFVVGVLLAVFARPYVTVDRRGLTVSGVLSWPRIRIPLERIEAADSRKINPLAEYGGWGYRIQPGRTGVMIRSGEGIVADLAGGRQFAVTVEDSATAAALLNTLVDQRRTEK